MKDRRRVKAGCAAAVLWLGVMLAACGGRTTDPAQETAAGGGLLGSLAEALNDGEKQEAQATQENREAESEQESAGGKTGKEKSSGSGGKAEKNAAHSPPEQLHALLRTVTRGKTDKKDYHKYIEHQFVELSLDEESAAKYPELAAALEDYRSMMSAENDRNMQDMYRIYDEMKAEGRELPPEAALCNCADGKIVRADSNVLSVEESWYMYYGGAHPDSGYRGVSFDPESGKRLIFEDVVLDTGRFFALVDEKLRKEYAEQYEHFVDLNEYVAELDRNSYISLEWSVGNEGVTVYFNPYELGSYSMGAQLVTVYFEEAPEIFDEKCRTVPERYIVPLAEDRALRLDIDGDGDREAVAVEKEALDEWGYKYSLRVDDLPPVRLLRYSSGEEAYVVRAEAGYFLYVFFKNETDDYLFKVIDLKTLENDDANDINADMDVLESQWEETEDGYERVEKKAGFTDPDSFSLSSTLYILSTSYGVKEYRVGRDGYPEEKSAWFAVDSSIVLRTKADISCELADRNSRNTGAAAVLPADRYVVITRTDGKSWVDLQEVEKSEVREEEGGDQVFRWIQGRPALDSAKNIYRIYWENQTINGFNEEELFEGMLYAD